MGWQILQSENLQAIKFWINWSANRENMHPISREPEPDQIQMYAGVCKFQAHAQGSVK